MPLDVARLREKLKAQQNVGVTQDGRVVANDPKNDGTDPAKAGNTTARPQRFAMP